MMKQKKGLGKGLNALIGNSSNDDYIEKAKTGVIEVDINSIEPNENQPRKFFDEESLAELAESIRNFGILQPLIVKDNGDFYTIIVGERRWRAARIAKIKTIPIIIKEYNDVDTIQIALIENIQREDLNPIEKAISYKRLIDEYFLTQEELADKVGKRRVSINYSLKLLNLDKRVQTFLSDGKLTQGHARSLLLIEDAGLQFSIAEHAIENDFSIKELDSYVKNEKYKVQKKQIDDDAVNMIMYPPRVFRALENDLNSILGTKVTIRKGKKKGKIEIEYYSDDELDRIIGIMKNNE